MPSAAEDLSARLRRISRPTLDGCWLTYIGIGSDGYCRATIGSRTDASRRTVLTHRLSYEVFVGPIPSDKEIDHTCRRRNCINPDHLEAVTHSINMKRAIPFNTKEICKHGHSLADAYVRKDTGKRRCRQCYNQRQKAYRAQRREKEKIDRG